MKLALWREHQKKGMLAYGLSLYEFSLKNGLCVKTMLTLTFAVELGN